MNKEQAEKRIKELRNALNLNQTNFGEQLGLKQTTFYKLVREEK